MAADEKSARFTRLSTAGGGLKVTCFHDVRIKMGPTGFVPLDETIGRGLLNETRIKRSSEGCFPFHSTVPGWQDTSCAKCFYLWTDARRPSAPTANQVWAAFQPQVSAHMGTEQANLVYDRICQNLARDPDRYPRGMTVLCAALFRK